MKTEYIKVVKEILEKKKFIVAGDLIKVLRVTPKTAVYILSDLTGLGFLEGKHKISKKGYTIKKWIKKIK